MEMFAWGMLAGSFGMMVFSYVVAAVTKALAGSLNLLKRVEDDWRGG